MPIWTKMDLFLKKLNMVVLKKLRIFAYMSVHLILWDGHFYIPQTNRNNPSQLPFHSPLPYIYYKYTITHTTHNEIPLTKTNYRTSISSVTGVGAPSILEILDINALQKRSAPTPPNNMGSARARQKFTWLSITYKGEPRRVAYGNPFGNSEIIAE